MPYKSHNHSYLENHYNNSLFSPNLYQYTLMYNVQPILGIIKILKEILPTSKNLIILSY